MKIFRLSPLLPLAFLAVSPALHAAIVSSGIVDLAIPTTFEGIYLNLDTGATGTSEFSGWDVNFVFGGSEIYNSDAFQPVRTGTGNSDAFRNLVEGFEIAAGTSFYSTNFGGSLTHLGNSPGQFPAATEGYLGFSFVTDGSAGPYYGWMRVTLTANTAGGVIHEWAYDDSGSAITIVPEPATWSALAGLCALALVLLRRRS